MTHQYEIGRKVTWPADMVGGRVSGEIVGHAKYSGIYQVKITKGSTFNGYGRGETVTVDFGR